MSRIVIKREVFIEHEGKRYKFTVMLEEILQSIEILDSGDEEVTSAISPQYEPDYPIITSNISQRSVSPLYCPNSPGYAIDPYDKPPHSPFAAMAKEIVENSKY